MIGAPHRLRGGRRRIGPHRVVYPLLLMMVELVARIHERS